MDFQQELARLAEIAPFPSFKDDIAAMIHKLDHPMKDILDKVPGDTLAERARTLGVSRQTMYVWAAERFRPSPDQAWIISKLTGVPPEHIRADGYREGRHDVGGSRKRPNRKLAKAGDKVQAGKRGTGKRRTRASVERVPRAVRKRTRHHPANVSP